MRNKKILIFTDLDGSLLDHDSYQWQPAVEALTEIDRRQIPLIFNTSKTAAEVLALQQETGLKAQPFLSENGLVLVFPGSESRVNGLDYTTIRGVLIQIREQHGFRFTGFGDCSTRQIVEMTGLSESEAASAAMRQASEPLLWEDSDRLLVEFQALLEAAGLSLQRGGRFYHVSSPGSKGLGVLNMLTFYQQQEPDSQWLTVGLGDGMNDLPMLEVVDIPVLIRSHHGAAPDMSHLPNIIKTEKTGPAGWNEAVLGLLRDETILSE